MPQNRYTVELDGKRYVLEGDSPPTEDDVRALAGSAPPEPSKTREENIAAQSGVLDKVSISPEGHVGTDVLSNAYDATVGGMVAGAKGLAKGLIRSPYDLAKNVAGLATALPGAVRGIDDALLHPVRTAGNVVNAVKQLPGMAANAVSGALQTAGADPEAFGEGIGSGLGQMGLTAGAGPLAEAAGGFAAGPGRTMATYAAKGLEAVGSPHVQTGATIVGAHQLLGGDPKGLATLAVPAGLGALGRKLTKGLAASPNAGGRLVKVPMRPLESMLNEARALPPEAALLAKGELPPSPTLTPTGRPSITPAAQAEMAANPLAQTGRAAGQLDHITQAIQDQRTPLSPLEQQGVRAAAPAEAPAALSAQPPASPLEAAAMGRLEKVPVSSVRPSKSSGSQGAGSQPSATPGLTVNDMSVIGINPSVRLTKLTPEMADAIDIARAQRHESYAQTARELRKQMADLK